jgi:ankyrin repeat protein
MVSKLAFLFLPVLGSAGVLHEAVQRCEVPEIKQMLAAGASANEMDGALDAPLHLAVRSGKPVCVYLLLAAGANPYPPDRAGATPHLLARRYPAGTIHDEMSFLLEGPALVRDVSYAIERGNADITRLLLDAGIDPNEPDSQGSAPLHHAALRGDLSVLEVLLDHGAAKEIFDKDGFLPLHLAALSGKPEVVSALLARGGKVSAVTRDSGESALHIAAAWGRLEVVRVLLASGADRQAKDSRGRTPLDRAGGANFPEVAALLRAAQ